MPPSSTLVGFSLRRRPAAARTLRKCKNYLPPSESLNRRPRRRPISKSWNSSPRPSNSDASNWVLRKATLDWPWASCTVTTFRKRRSHASRRLTWASRICANWNRCCRSGWRMPTIVLRIPEGELPFFSILRQRPQYFDCKFQIPCLVKKLLCFQHVWQHCPQ